MLTVAKIQLLDLLFGMSLLQTGLTPEQATAEILRAQHARAIPSSQSVTENLMSVPPSPAPTRSQIAVMDDEAVAAPPCVPSAPGNPALVRLPQKNTRRARTESHALKVHPKAVGVGKD